MRDLISFYGFLIGHAQTVTALELQGLISQAYDLNEPRNRYYHNLLDRCALKFTRTQYGVYSHK